MNDRLFEEVNQFARATTWLHGAVLATMAVAAGLLVVAAAALMGFARVYIAAHYPADVLAGCATVALLGYAIARPPVTVALHRLEETRLRPLLDASPSPDDPAAQVRQPGR